jgi:hypothetical protein
MFNPKHDFNSDIDGNANHWVYGGAAKKPVFIDRSVYYFLPIKGHFGRY